MHFCILFLLYLRLSCWWQCTISISFCNPTKLKSRWLTQCFDTQMSASHICTLSFAIFQCICIHPLVAVHNFHLFLQSALKKPVTHSLLWHRCHDMSASHIWIAADPHHRSKNAILMCSFSILVSAHSFWRAVQIENICFARRVGSGQMSILLTPKIWI